MATDFAVSLRRFLTDHLAGLRGCSPNTIVSYRDTFKLLICYFRDERSIPPERLTLELIDIAAVTEFLTWLRTSRHNSPSTCNQRLAAISSFYSWMWFASESMTQIPDFISPHPRGFRHDQ
jgi:integrase/recombinase XerD